MESTDDDLTGRGPYTGEQAPLSLRFETRRHWSALKAEFGVDETGAAVVLALYGEALTRGRWTSYSRTPGHYLLPFRHENKLYTLKRIRGAADYLAGAGLVDHFKQQPGVRGWQSAMKARPELIARTSAILQAGPRLVAARPGETIILRDDEGIEVGYADTTRTGRMRRTLEHINEAMRGVDVANGAGACLVRIFNRTFERGGRFYAVGGAFQGLPKEDRRRLTIDGEEVVEVDFKTLHPALLYAKVGAPRPEDSYAIGNWPRPLVKVGLLILVNATSWRSARDAIAHNDAMELMDEPGSDDARQLAGDLIEAIKRVHVPIRGAFHGDAGAGLMRQDSEMAEKVMTRLLKKAVVVLPVHDSFIAPASKKALLEEAMMTVAEEAGVPDILLESA